MEEIIKTVINISTKNIEDALLSKSSKIIVSKTNTEAVINTEELFKSFLNDKKDYVDLYKKIRKIISGFSIENSRIIIKNMQSIFNNLKFCNFDLKNKTFIVKIRDKKVLDVNKKYIEEILYKNCKQPTNKQPNDFIWLFFVIVILLIVTEKIIINPLIILSLIYMLFYIFNIKENSLESDYFYIYNSLDKYLNVTKISENKITDESKQIESYGNADFYEVYRDKIILYKNNSNENSLNKIKSDFKGNLKIYKFVRETSKSGEIFLKANPNIKPENIRIKFNHDILDSYVVDNPRIDNMVGYYTSELNEGILVAKLNYKSDEEIHEIDNLFLHETIVYRKKYNNNKYLLLLVILSFVLGILKNKI